MVAPGFVLPLGGLATQRGRSMASGTGGGEGGHATGVEEALGLVRGRIEQACAEAGVGSGGARLVAVSKTKPVELLMEAYSAGQRVFGENYAQELTEKCGSMPDDVQWHFIGHLQSNKAKKLVHAVPNLEVVETVDSLKLAKKLDAACGDNPSGPRTLGIYLQVHTSTEDTKSGVMPGDVPALATAVVSECPHLKLQGLMTIGAPGDFSCFDRLVQCRQDTAEALGVALDELELSMGMSGDFEEAIASGATSVRVGSTIFGARAYAASRPPS